jgi:ribosomal protein L32
MVERNVLYQVKPKTAKKLGLSTKFPFTKGREIVKEVDACGECGESVRFHRIRTKNYKKDKRVYHDTVQEATPLN